MLVADSTTYLVQPGGVIPAVIIRIVNDYIIIVALLKIPAFLSTYPVPRGSWRQREKTRGTA
jgi:hypothetical protein